MAGPFVTFPNGDPRPKLLKMQRAVFDAALDTVHLTVQFAAARAKQNLTDAGRVDRGSLRASIDSRVTADSFYVTGAVFAGAAWAPWVEFGRLGAVSSPAGIDRRKAARAAWPPVGVILDWVRRHAKLLAPSGRTASGRARKADPQDLRTAAFLVGRKIYRHGVRPTPFMLPAYLQGKRYMAGVFDRLLRKALKQ